jgi:hypothetical protein
LADSLGRNILTGPGLASVDYALVKNSHIAELFNVQFRAECFNLLNRANFQVPPLINGTDIFESTGRPKPHRGCTDIDNNQFATDSSWTEDDLVSSARRLASGESRRRRG